MQKFIFKFGVVSVLIAGGFLVVCALPVPHFFARYEATTAVNNAQPISLLSQKRNASSRKVEIGATEVPEAEYKARLIRIKQWTDLGNFQELVWEGDEIQEMWGKVGGENFAKLILEVTNAFGYSRICDGHPEVGDLSRKYASVALERSDSYSLESEWDLVMKLRWVANVPSFNDAEALQLRKSSKLWLHLLRRLERERDSTFDPNKSLSMWLDPPEELSLGGIVDPAVKARFQAAVAENNKKLKRQADQYKLRNLAEIAEPWGTEFLAKVYSRPPFSREELNSLLSEYPIGESLRKSILKATDHLAPTGSQ